MDPVTDPVRLNLLGNFHANLRKSPFTGSIAGENRAELQRAEANFGKTSFAIISIEARIFFCSKVAKFIMKMM